MSETPKEWNHPAFTEKGKVICQVCGKPYMILTPSHLKTHDGLTYSEYKNQFPGAPITTEEFKALSKYSTPSKYTDEDIEILGKETIIDDIPVIDDEFELPKEITRKFDNPMEAKRFEILSFLRGFLPNVIQDHMITIGTIQGTIIYSTISDYADPVKQINIEFPDTFWHNSDLTTHNPNRTGHLEENGWKVVTVKGTNPKIKDIEKELRKVI